jgi:Ca2+-binding EF-hand superfamily protein
MMQFAAGWGEAELSVAEVFRRFDRDGSGTLDLSEVERLAAALGVVLSRNSAQDMFAQVGTSTQPEWSLWRIRIAGPH